MVDERTNLCCCDNDNDIATDVRKNGGTMMRIFNVYVQSDTQ
jgi:hypothetical protein